MMRLWDLECAKGKADDENEKNKIALEIKKKKLEVEKGKREELTRLLEDTRKAREKDAEDPWAFRGFSHIWERQLISFLT